MTSAEIVTLLNSNPRAIERAIQALIANNLLRSDYDRSGAKYYASWIDKGNRLSGNHIVKARQLAIRYASDLARISQADDPQVKDLTMDREGDFTVRTVPGSDHCGTQPVQAIRYQVQVVCSPKLDSRGFLIDQLNVDRFFQAQRITDLSREKLALHLAKGLRSALVKENPAIELRSLRLTLSPEPYKAKMTVNL